MTNPTTQIRPMREPEFDIWFQQTMLDYAREKAQVMEIAEDQALQLSQESFSSGLPDGLATAHNYLFSILNGQEEVIGAIWFEISTKWGRTIAFIYDVQIDEKHRRQGHAEAAMKLIEPEAKKHGAAKLGLHVFEFNTAAVSLYEKMGYETTDISMAKKL